MKKLSYLLSIVILFLVSVSFVDAASFSIKTSKSTVVVGNTVTITVEVNGSDAFGWEYCLNYDTSVFSLSSANSDTGGKCVKTGSTLTGYKTVTYKLKAKKSGSSTFSLSGAAIYDDDLKVISSSANSVTVKAKTQAEIEASYSTNANLNNLKVDGYEITPKFDKDTLKYSLEVENEVEKVTIRASKADSSASVSGTGEKELTEGINKFNIVVTAEKGNKKTYVLEVNRKELNPIHVIVDGKDYNVVRKAEVIEAPTYYSSTEIEIDGEVVPALKSDITGYVLVGLKDEAGNIGLYSYDDLKNTYKLYKQIGTEGNVIIPLETTEVIEEYNSTKDITINNVDVKVNINSKDDTFVLIYGMNASTGKSGWYKYDTLEGTFQRYEVVAKEVKKEANDLYFILTIVFAGISGITILVMIILMVMNSKMRKKNIKLITMLESMKTAKVEKVSLKEELENKSEVIVKDDVNKEKVDVKEDVKTEEPLSKRELRRLEKEKMMKEQAELAEMQDAHEETSESLMNENSNNSEEVENTTKKRGKKRN